MKTILSLIASLVFANIGLSQCGQTKLFVTNVGFQNAQITVNNNVATVTQTHSIDLNVNPIAHVNGLSIIPQSTLFFAASNQNFIDFQTRDLIPSNYVENVAINHFTPVVQQRRLFRR